MTALALVVVIGSLLAIVAVLVSSSVRIVRWALRQPPTVRSAHTEVPTIPFGGLPNVGPVGRLGTLDPSSDLSDVSERDLA